MAYAEKRRSTAKGSKGKVTWRSRYKKPDGSMGSEPGFPTKKTAEDWGEKQEAAIRAQKWTDPGLQETHFGEFARKFMGSTSKRGNTVAKRWFYLETYILPKWDHTPIRAFNWFDVDAWQQRLDCDDVTRGHVVSLTSTILTAAMDAGLRDVNPVYGRRRTKPTGKGARKDAPKKVVGNDGYVPPERVILLAQRLGPARGLHVLTTAFAGPRWGEGIGLHRDNALRTRQQIWDGGVFECPVIRICEEIAEYEERDPATGKKLGTFLGIEDTKNDGSTRDVDVPPFLALLLGYHLADWPHDRIFCTSSGTPWRRGNWGKVLRPAADGAPARQGNRHVESRPPWEPIMPGLDMRSLRKTHDSWQSQIGVKDPLAYEAAGHKREGIKAIYQKPTVEMRIARLEGLEEIFQRAMRNLGLRTLWGRVDLRKTSQMITPKAELAT